MERMVLIPDMNNTTSNGFAKPPESYWISSIPQTNFPHLEEDVKVDVVIVGGGMTGITSAFLLKEEGLTVAVIEADQILHGTTGHTTAKVTSQHDLIYYKIKSQMGQEMAKMYADANETAINTIASLIERKKIDCDFYRSSAYVYTQDDKYIQQILDETNTAASLGIQAFYLVETPLPFSVKAAVRFDNQARFHPLKYLIALANEIPGNGSYIFEHTRAIDIHEDKYCHVVTNSGKRVTADKVVVASHFPFYDGYGYYFSRLFPYRSYIVAVKIKGEFPEGMYISAEKPVHSLRYQNTDDGGVVLIAGENHKTGQGKDTSVHYENLKNFAQKIFEVEDIPFRWSTQDYTSADEVPYTGHLSSKTPNIYVATGFRKWGMTNSTASSIILRDLIIGRENPWKELYNPSRFTPGASAKNFIVENADVAKHLVVRKLAAVPDSDDVDLNPGEGRVVEMGGQKMGAYKDEQGRLHLVDTTCTHMGCELQWNSAEKSWDCPCHGSRFTYDGDIIEGPAQRRIKKEIQEQ
ncbi:MAG TPA: FAD-dependent oxidoreductase [Clostridiales bacterium]|nr:FAD-dependent oxidoreductase [Clostridiales bacterium]